MKCPTCNVELIVVERLSIELDYCMGCRGFWFDREELSLLTRALDLPLDIPDIETLPGADVRERDRRCPRCSRKMDKVQMEGPTPVILDRCPEMHGLWFEEGELGRILDAPGANSGSEDKVVLNFLGEVFHPEGGSE
ncbi:MAG TPA: zf-TFIIB domain-containing protein [Thermoanaerobaculia bacterium]|nr:zf-TFIIB domain-containing protein [Thermoanaerobaculia bacterium]HUM29621.1 zf-TFIIB domain-containing protein [Thermoanaerobaculia bacterium]HXK67272.1 zf-TFIIB domain-containing protein [Thermoanaerobaculia bacterium]